MKKNRVLLLAAIVAGAACIGGATYMLVSKNGFHKTTAYPAAVLGAKEGFSPLLPKGMAIADSSFTNGVLVFSVTNSSGTRFVITEQKTPAGFTSDMFRGARSIPTLYGIAKSTNLNGATTIGMITNKSLMVTITATPAAGNEQVDTLLTSLGELTN